MSRRYPIGAEILSNGAVSFRVWAPRRKRVAIVIGGENEERAAKPISLHAEERGYFSGESSALKAGDLYRYKLDDDTALYPDPASRFQPNGPHGASQIVDTSAFRWTDRKWQGIAAHGKVIYELHVGTFTREGTWRAATRELDELARLGINIVEVMPVAEFAGRFGWGYDGVDLFAPSHLYGSPEDFRAFVDRAHALGVAVILDVVYNHFGPDGCYLREFSDTYFSDHYKNEWGDPINFEGEDGEPVREFFVANAGYWIDEYHLDGLRLDATQQIFDVSDEHIIAAVTRAVREAGGKRTTFVACENEPQELKLVRRTDAGGYGADALWNDDFHHAAAVALTGRKEAYCSDYGGSPQELISALKWGYLYQGQQSSWQKGRRGTPALDAEPGMFVDYLENHDQTANSAFGLRLHNLTSPARYRAMTAVLLLGPHTPMLFQGQEFAASTPFLFFADHDPELAAAVRKGRAEFLSQFPSIAAEEVRNALPDPGAVETFERCKLDLSERERHVHVYALHRDLLRLRREDPVFSKPRHRGIDGVVVGPHAFALRFFAQDGQDRLLVVNLGIAVTLDIVPEPLLAPPTEHGWRVLWSSESLRYGGTSAQCPEREDGWYIAGEVAIVLEPAA